MRRFPRAAMGNAHEICGSIIPPLIFQTALLACRPSQ
jgi:hypothetical protein